MVSWCRQSNGQPCRRGHGGHWWGSGREFDDQLQRRRDQHNLTIGARAVGSQGPNPRRRVGRAAVFSYLSSLGQECQWPAQNSTAARVKRGQARIAHVVIILPKRADSPGVIGTRKDAMVINAGSSVSNTASASGSGNPQSTIASLERQLTKVEKKISEVSRDKSLSAEAKQEELALYQEQEQLIEAQIQQIQQQQEQQSLARAAAKQAAGATTSNQKKTTTSLIDVVA